MYVVKVTVYGVRKWSYYLGPKPEHRFGKNGIYEVTKKENAYKIKDKEAAEIIAKVIGDFSDQCEGKVEEF